MTTLKTAARETNGRSFGVSLYLVFSANSRFRDSWGGGGGVGFSNKDWEGGYNFYLKRFWGG